jgi:hypothetical protein
MHLSGAAFIDQTGIYIPDLSSRKNKCNARFISHITVAQKKDFILPLLSMSVKDFLYGL